MNPHDDITLPDGSVSTGINLEKRIELSNEESMDESAREETMQPPCDNISDESAREESMQPPGDTTSGEEPTRFIDRLMDRRKSKRTEYLRDYYPWEKKPRHGIECMRDCFICHTPDANIFELFLQEIVILLGMCCFPFCRSTFIAMFYRNHLLMKLFCFCLLPCACVADLLTVFIWLFNFVASTFVGVAACCVCCYSPTYCFLYNWITYINGFFYGCFTTCWCCGFNFYFLPCKADAWGYGRGPNLMKSRVLPCLRGRKSFMAAFCHWGAWFVTIAVILVTLLVFGVLAALIVLMIIVVVVLCFICIMALGSVGGGDCGDCGCSGGDCGCGDCGCSDCGCDDCGCGECAGCSLMGCCEAIGICGDCMDVAEIVTNCCLLCCLCSICRWNNDTVHPCYLCIPKDKYVRQYNEELRQLV